jgi:hypothetical protein
MGQREIAMDHNVVYEQLGGNKFAAMVGVKHRAAGKDYLDVRFSARATNGINHIQVRLVAGDGYNVRFFSVRGLKCPDVENVQASELKRVFTEKTGLSTHL